MCLCPVSGIVFFIKAVSGNELTPSKTLPVPVTVLQVCERLIEKIIQVKAHTVPSPTAFRSDREHRG